MVEAQRASADDLIRAIKGTNPFQSIRVSSPNDVRVDVGEVHGAHFKRLTSYIDQIRRDSSSCGILLVGGPGTGKSHLLGRLARWAKEHSAAFVFLHNLQASPERMPRYVLKATISSVFTFRNGVYGNDELLSLLRNAVERHEGALRALDTGDPADPAIAAVLGAFMKIAGDPAQASLADAAVDWMSGDEIDEEQAKALGGLGKRRIPSQLPDGAAVERVLMALATLLALDDKVLVLCLDQIDNLDADQVRSLMVFLHALIDHARNLAVITSGVKTSVNAFKEERVISEAAWDRVAEHVIELQEITRADARRLIGARTDEFFHPFEAVKSLVKPRRQDSLFPLGSPWFDDLFGKKKHVRPRDAMTLAREEWERVQHDIDAEGGAKWLAAWRPEAPPKKTNGHSHDTPSLQELIDRVVSAKVQECRGQRMLNPGTLPPDTDNLCRLTANLLSKCVERPEYSLLAVEPEKAAKKGSPPPFAFIITEHNGKGRQTRTGVTCLPGGHGRAVTNALDRILKDQRPLDHVLVVSDERRPPRFGDRGKEHYEALEKRGPDRFRHIRLSEPQVVELDALDSVLGLARVGDLEIEYPPGSPRPVSEPEAAEAMHRLHLFVEHPFLRELLTEGDLPDLPQIQPDPLEDRVIRECIADYLSWRFGANAAEMRDRLLEDHPDADPVALHRQVIRVADIMHNEGKLQSTPQDQDRFLLWKGGSA
jgi:Cdc6-like AAA superfamily ATPase